MVTIPIAFDRLYSRGAGIDPAREKSLRISESSSPEELTLLRGLERLYGGIERFREFVVENGKHIFPEYILAYTRPRDDEASLLDSPIAGRFKIVALL